jgi:uncharacterized protein (DUF2126 family)
MKTSMTDLLIAAVGLGLGLAGCSGGAGGYQSVALPPVSTVDTFTQTVQSVSTLTTETGAPLNTDGYAAVSADNAAPISIN